MKHSKRYPLNIISLAAAILSGLQLYADAVRPNVLFIAVDDLKPSIGAYGDERALTPNINRLAEAGTVFLNNHCQKAICGPSRASLMTGMRPDSIRVWVFGERMRDINPNLLSLPEHFKNHGYTTTAIGKIYDPRNVSGRYDPESWTLPHKTWDDYLYHPDYQGVVNGHYHNEKSKKAYAEARAQGLSGYQNLRSFLREKEAWPVVECLNEDVPDNAYTDGAIALRAIEMLKELGTDKTPFFLGVGFAKPHFPFVAPKKYWDLYKRESIQIHPFQKKSSNPVDMAYHANGELKSYSGIPDSMDSNSENPKNWLAAEKQRELIHGYYACVSYVDAQIGKLMATLDKTGLADNTVVVLWGDHGFHLGDHGLWHKHTNFEQATRSPLIITAPGFKTQSSQSPVEFIDIFPTLCELARLPVPPKLDGESLIPLMREGTASVKPFAVSQYT